MQLVLVSLLEGLSLSRNSVVRLTDRPDMTLVVYRGRKQQTTKKTISHLVDILRCLEYTLRKHFITLWYTLNASIS